MIPKISIVIPVYNAEEFLKTSLDSVLAQSLHDIEVLCTDDGSTDRSLAILQEYARRDPRVRVFHQENKGAGPARNLSLSHARGEYVAFMDGDDDYPEKDTLERLYNAAKEKNCPIVAGYRTLLTEEGIHVDIHDPLYDWAQKHPEGIMLEYKDVQYDFNYQCYLFERRILVENDITFPDYRRCQDPPFLVRAMIAAQKFYLLPISSYLYRWGHQNIKWNKRKINDLLKAHIDLLTLSRDAELTKLHDVVATRLNSRYKGIILGCLNRENLELVALLVYANSITNFEWFQSRAAEARQNGLLASVADLIPLLDDLITVSAPAEGDSVTRMIEEIYEHYLSLPGADARILNDVILRTLARLYLWTRPYYVRKQLAAFMATPRYAAITGGCSSELKAVADAREVLDAVLPGFAYYEGLQTLRDEQVHNCRCVHDSRTGGAPKVSIIVPVYNVEPYIGECLESLVKQTCGDIEIICVDDGSTDASLEIVMQYARRHENFVVLHQDNSGLSVARNSGMKYASGTYLHFLDSDDFMEPDSYQRLLEKAQADQLDVLFFDGQSYYEDEALKKEFPWYETGYDSKSVGDPLTDTTEYFLKTIVARDFRVSACMYLVRREFLQQHQIRFIEGIVHEDNYFTYACVLRSQRISHLTAALYHRRVVRGSITIRAARFRHAYGYFRSYWALRELVDSSDLSVGLKDMVSLKLIDMLKNARNEYAKIVDPQDLTYHLALPSVEGELFYLMVVDPVEQMKAMGGSGRRDWQAAGKQGSLISRGIQCYRDHGLVYTIGYTFRKLGGKFRGGIRCCKEHGVLYTIKHGLKKIIG